MAHRVLKVARDLTFIPAVRIILWVLLATAAVLTVTGMPTEMLEGWFGGSIPRVLHLVPAIVFAAFMVGFAVYRFTLVRKGRYNAGKAFIQVGMGVLVIALLLPQNFNRFKAAASTDVELRTLAPLLDHPDAHIRAVACEALASRGALGAAPDRARARVLAKEDPDEAVRAACARVE